MTAKYFGYTVLIPFVAVVLMLCSLNVYWSSYAKISGADQRNIIKEEHFILSLSHDTVVLPEINIAV